MPDPIGTVLFNRLQIQQAVDGIVHEVILWTKTRPTKTLNLVSVLEGAKPFTRDLVARLEQLTPELEVKIHEVRIKGTDGTSLLKDRHWQEGRVDPEAIQAHPILLVDDLVDSGMTLNKLRSELVAMGAKEIKTVVLVRKFGEASGTVDFCGFDLNLDRKILAQKGLKDYWLFGYGMDLDGQLRELEHIGWVEIT